LALLKPKVVFNEMIEMKIRILMLWLLLRKIWELRIESMRILKIHIFMILMIVVVGSRLLGNNKLVKVRAIFVEELHRF
jgi:hypothetical protein